MVSLFNCEQLGDRRALLNKFRILRTVTSLRLVTVLKILNLEVHYIMVPWSVVSRNFFTFCREHFVGRRWDLLGYLAEGYFWPKALFFTGISAGALTRAGINI